MIAQFRHSKDIPITRESICKVQMTRAKLNLKPATAAEIVKTLVSIPNKRHVRRATRLMRKEVG